MRAMSVVKVCGPMKIDDEWLEVFADDLAACGFPRCRYCSKPVGKGGYADHLWPYHDDYSFHQKCRRASDGPSNK
jgi:hypothetical protein